MNIDIRTLSFIIGLSFILQTFVLLFQYRVNRSQPGPGWWVLGSASLAVGFLTFSQREHPRFGTVAVLALNACLLLGITWLYVGTLRFLGLRERRDRLVPFCVLSTLFTFYFTFFNDSLSARRLNLSLTLAAMSFLIAWTLIKYRTRVISASAVLLGLVFLATGAIWCIRGFDTLTSRSADHFVPTLIQSATGLGMLMTSTLSTFGFVLMVNQHLNAANRTAKETVDRTLEDLREEQARTTVALEHERQIVAEQKQFLSMVSHEFRTPLAVIDGAAQMARRAVKTPTPNLEASTGIIQRSVADLLSLLETWLAQDRIASGLWAPRLQTIPLAEWMAEVVQHTQDAFPERKLVLETGELPPAFVCDPDLLGIALQNLLGNALKYSPEGSLVTVRGNHGDGWLHLSVIDHGHGIPADQVDQVTMRYFRGRNSGKIPGLGLGLSLVSTIAALHGGRLELESLEGQGATARLLLPFLAPAP